jgi:two-component system alkaline phosphatase synthesis response regulator PhoP
LVVEDEPALAEVLVDNLEQEGYQVGHASDGLSAMETWRRDEPDLIILDVMLPYLDGFELCRTLRREGLETPVLFLSARGRAEDRVEGLKAGGDDYLPKPFHLPEFLLRVENLLRRSGWRQETARETFAFGGHRIDFRSWTVYASDGRREALGERELGILRLFVSRSDEVVSRDDVLDEVWGDDVFPSSRTVDNFVMRLRKIFEPDPSKPIYFHTVWGVGYKFTPDGTEPP